MSAENYVVEMTDIEKNFAAVKAVDHSFFNLKKGEIHSLIGENGAGKSTMMKMLYGLYQPDAGEIKIGGEKMQNLTPGKAIEKGIGMVHQEFMLVNELTVLENVILGFEPKKGVTINFEEARKKIQTYIDNYHMEIQPDKRIDQISVGEAQRVEIIKTLYRGANVLIMDEPTAVLTPQECVKFFEILQELKKDGKSIIFISHKLNEVMEISDRISVMRAGKYITTVDKKDTNPTELAKLMVGRNVNLHVKSENAVKPGETVLKVENLWTSGEKENSKIRGISFHVRAGETVGIAGVDGNGQSELIEAITGLRKVEKGSVILNGKNITNFSPKKAREAGLSHIPEERNIRGLNRAMSIEDNLAALKFEQKPFSSHHNRNKKEVRKFAEDLIEKFDIRPKKAEVITQSLSGGNAQKIVIAREVDAGGELLIAAQPTRGVDIGAIESIRTILENVKKDGKAILLVSADLDEVMDMSDRIVVMYEGKITGILDAKTATKEKVGLYMLGQAEQNREEA